MAVMKGYVRQRKREIEKGRRERERSAGCMVRDMGKRERGLKERVVKRGGEEHRRWGAQGGDVSVIPHTHTHLPVLLCVSGACD